MEEAHLKCAAAAQVEERKKKNKKNKKKNKGKNKGKGKKCDVDLDVLDEFFAGVWEKKACILKEVRKIDCITLKLLNTCRLAG